MHTIRYVGQVVFAMAVGSLGAVLLITGNFLAGLLPVPATVPARMWLAYGTGLLLVGAGIGMLLRNRQSAIAAGLIFLLLGLLLHAPRWVANPFDGRVWTALFELVALAGGAFVLADQYNKNPALHQHLGRYGRILFSVALLVFGGLHVVYGPFIATLIPAWIPLPLFWAYLVGVAFVATALSIMLCKQMKLATLLLGVMFGLWVLLLHAPRVVLNPTVEAEWTSLFVALAMSGISFILADDA